MDRRATFAEMVQHPWLVQYGVAVMTPLEHVVVQRMRQASFLPSHLCVPEDLQAAEQSEAHLSTE